MEKIVPFDRSVFRLPTLRVLNRFKSLKEGVREDQFRDVYGGCGDRYGLRSQDIWDDRVRHVIYETPRALKACRSNATRRQAVQTAAECRLRSKCLGLSVGAVSEVRGAFGDEDGFVTEFLATPLSRAPEITVTLKQYTKAIDICWVGSIVADMLSGGPLFPGHDLHHQFTLVLDVQTRDVNGRQVLRDQPRGSRTTPARFGRSRS
ncbi:hypothetical protein C8Q76DRAFT_803883 [Earliella scabrosa]|nr:hypothetical protein C8Q76DRAFT_803883 [Earliella scabrosa]